MADSTDDSKKLIPLDEESEGNSIGSGDFIFRKIGRSVPLKPTESSFEFEAAPLQALAISERFRVVFLTHSEGFYVAKTKDIIELAKEIKKRGKGSGSIQELSIVDVPIDRVSILALSTDSSTLAACVGGNVHLFSVASLINKDKAPTFSWSLGESVHVKDLRWRKNEANSYVVLSSHGKLYYGDLKSPLKDVMDSVDAVDWSVKGDYIAIAKENTLRILSSDFEERFHMLLLFQPWAGDTDCIAKVDSIRWVRGDSIMVGCLQLTDDGEEEDYLVQVITNCKDELIEASSNLSVVSFGELFASLDHQIVPFGSGPYLLVSYLEHWELVLASNRKNTDQHIVSLGWSLDDNHREVAAIEFRQDKEVPRIELPDNGDDNLIVGFGVDKVSLYEKIEFIKSDGEHKELNPYCVLLCLTSDGKVIMFHAARISDPSVLPTVPSGDITSVEEDSSTLFSRKPTVEDIRIETVVLDDKSSPVSKEAIRDATMTGSQKPFLTPASVSDDKSRPLSGKAFDINKVDVILKESTLEVTELKEPSRFPSVAGQTFGIETGKSIITSDPGDKKHDSLLIMANKEQKSLMMIQKPEVDAECNSSLTGQVNFTSATISGLSSQQVSNLEKLPVKLPLTLGLGPASKDVTETERQNLMPTPAAVVLNPGSSVRSLLSDTSSNIRQGFKDSLKGTEGDKGLAETLGSNNFQSVPSGSLCSEKLSVSNDLNASAASFASSGSVHGEKQETTGVVTRKAALVPASQSSPSNFQLSGRNFSSKDPRASPSPSGFPSSKPNQSEGQRSTITGARTSDFASSQSFLSFSQEESKLAKSHFSKGKDFLNNSRTHRSTRMLDSDLQVNEMVKELDSLLADIEGEGGFGNPCTVYLKDSIMELEAGLEDLLERCRVCKSAMEEKLEGIQHLLDKTMQVLARKTYVEGIVKQASSTQYWELWNCQKLSPEFELKRRQILKLNQSLMSQIIELERHFNALELNKFGDRGRAPMGRRTFHSSSESSRQTQSLQSLYNTMNSQLAAAEQLSECLSRQMAVLNIESPPVKKQGAAKALFESIGLTYDGHSFQSPDAKTAGLAPDSTKKFQLSSLSAIKELPRRDASGSLKGIEPETARRRRDSLDRSLARFEPQKTTVKRMLLEEQSKVSANKSSFGIGKEIFSSPLGDGFSFSHQTDCTASSLSSLLPTSTKNHPNSYPSNKDIQEKSSTQMSISSSVSPFKWAMDNVGSLPVGSVSSSTQQNVDIRPLSTVVVASPLSIVQNNAKVDMGSSQSSSITEAYVAQSRPSMVQNTSINETGHNVQPDTLNQTPLRVSSTALPTKPASARKTVHMKTQASDLSNLKSGEFVQSKQMIGSMNPGARPLESSFATPQSVHASQTDTPSRVQSGETATSLTVSSTISSSPLSFARPFPSSTFSSSSLISASLESSLSSIPASTLPSSSESSPLAMPFGGSVPGKGIDKTVPPSSSSSISTSFLSSSGPSSFQMQKQQVSPPLPSPTENVAPHAPASQPDVLDEFSSKLGPAQSASEISARLSSGSQPSSHATTSTNNIFGAVSNSAAAAAAAALDSQLEGSSAPLALFPAQSVSTTQGKTETLDSNVTEEDDMEEEAPETTSLSLGALGGFRLGSSPAPSAPKPNLFGVSLGGGAASPASPPFSLTVPRGELFRPASFSFSSATPQPSQPTSHDGFSGFGIRPTLTPSTGSGFGRPAQIGAGQQALGSVLGGFGQSRQLGPGLPGVGFSSSSGFGGGGFAAPAMSGGFGSGAGFAGATMGVGFAGLASGGGGGFAAAASAGGGFAAAASAGAFAAAASSGGGFAGASSGAPTGGFGAFRNSGAGAFSSFGGKPPELFTQMRR